MSRANEPRILHVAGPRLGFSKANYDGAELRPYTGRPGTNQALALPSRFGDQLRYRDGTVRIVPVARGGKA